MQMEADVSDTNELDGAVALVTGGGNGIGAGISRTLAKRGARVLVGDVSLQSAEEVAATIGRAGGEARAVLLDVTSEQSNQDALDMALAQFGSFDILVNNAGLASQEPFLEISEETWNRLHDVNAKALFFSCQLFGRHLMAQHAGAIVNIASYAGREPIVEYAHYNSSKAAAISITQTLALELAPHNVTVNSVCPGIVRSRMWDDLPDEQWQMQTAKVPLGRAQTAEDIGEAVSFLASGRARNITGMSLGVTGGLSIW